MDTFPLRKILHKLVSERIGTYRVHSWIFLFRSSYRKLNCLGFKPVTTEFCSEALINWAIRSWVQIALSANFVQLLQLHIFFQCFGFILPNSLGSCSIRSCVQLTLRANFVQLFQFHLFFQCLLFILVIAFCNRQICFKTNYVQVITILAEWTDTYGTHHWRTCLRSIYKNLTWVGFEITTTEFQSDAQTDLVLRSEDQLSLTVNFPQLLQFNPFVQCSLFIFYNYFKQNLTHVITLRSE